MDGNLIVRRSQPSDLAEIDALLGESYPILLKPDYPPSILVTAVPLISKAKPELVASGSYFVVSDEGAIVGAGGWTAAAPPGMRSSRGVGHIRHVVTDYRHVRRGVGALLMETVFSTAQKAGIVRMECLSTRTAVPFYEACGFVRGRDVTIPLRPGIDFPAVFMERSLAG